MTTQPAGGAPAPMTDLHTMRAERDRLNRQIRQAETDAAAEFNSDLCELSLAIYQHARDNHIPWTDSTRKNWTTITLAGRLTINLGEHDPHYGNGGLTITTPGITAQLDPLPTPHTLTQLITHLLTLDDGPAPADGDEPDLRPATRRSPMTRAGFQAAFLTDPAALTLDIHTYTADVDPADLLDGQDNTTSPPPLDQAAADRALAAAGYARHSDWNYTDDIWGAIIRPIDPLTHYMRPGGGLALCGADILHGAPGHLGAMNAATCLGCLHRLARSGAWPGATHRAATLYPRNHNTTPMNPAPRPPRPAANPPASPSKIHAIRATTGRRRP